MYRILYNICEVIDMDRREKIIQIIQRNEKPISASTLAKQLGVSRQIIVGDVALIRASGTHIIATPRGYVLDDNKEDTLYTIAVHHQKKDLIDELYTIVDLGGYIIDVIVEHPIYGQLCGKLHLSSRYDVDQFIKKVNINDAKPLSELTDGLHLHTIKCLNNETFERIKEALNQKGYLFTK